MVGHVERFNPAVGEAARAGRRRPPRHRLPRPRDPGRAAADADPGHRRRDRPRHPRPRRDAARPRPLDRRDLRRRRPLPAQLPGGSADLPRPLRRRGRRDTLGLLDVNWLTPEKTREIALIGENGLLRRQLHHPGRLVRRVAERPAALGRALDAARRRRGRRGALLARQGRAAAGRAGSLLPLRARRHAGAGQRPRRRQGAGRGAGRARVGGGAPPGRAARHPRPPTTGGRSRDPLRHPGLQRGREHPPPARRPGAGRARARRPRDHRRRRLHRRHRRRDPRTRPRHAPGDRHPHRQPRPRDGDQHRHPLGPAASPPTTTRSSPSRPTPPPTSPTCRGCWSCSTRAPTSCSPRSTRRAARSSASPAGAWRRANRVSNTFRYLGGLREIHTLSSLYRVYRAGTLRRAADTYGYLLVREPGFAANVELLLKLYNAGASVAEVPTTNDWRTRKGESKMQLKPTVLAYFRVMAAQGAGRTQELSLRLGPGDTTAASCPRDDEGLAAHRQPAADPSARAWTRAPGGGRWHSPPAWAEAVRTRAPRMPMLAVAGQSPTP